MSTEKSTKSLISKKIVFVGALVLTFLFAMARFVFGVSREFVQMGLSLVILGGFFFSLFDLLRSKRHVAAVVVFVCAMLYLVTTFCLWR